MPIRLYCLRLHGLSSKRKCTISLTTPTSLAMMRVFDFGFVQENENLIDNSLGLWAWQSTSMLLALTEMFVLSWLDTVQIKDDYLLLLLPFLCPFVITEPDSTMVLITHSISPILRFCPSISMNHHHHRSLRPILDHAVLCSLFAFLLTPSLTCYI